VFDHLSVEGPHTECHAVCISPGTTSQRSGTKRQCRISSECCGCAKLPEMVPEVSVTDKPREGRPVQLDIDALRAAMEANPMQTVEELANKLHVTHLTAHRHLHGVSKLGKWVPHALTPQQKRQRVDIFSCLLSAHPSQTCAISGQGMKSGSCTITLHANGSGYL